MKLKAVIHEAEEGGYWAEIPAIPGCATQGETFEELLKNVHEAVEGCLGADIDLKGPDPTARVMEIAVLSRSPEGSSSGFSRSTVGN